MSVSASALLRKHFTRTIEQAVRCVSAAASAVPSSAHAYNPELWSADVQPVYNELSKLTENPDWVQCSKKTGDDINIRRNDFSSAEQDFQCSLFLNTYDKSARGVVKFKTEENAKKRFVHGGQASTALHTIMSVICDQSITASQAASLNIELLDPLEVGTPALLNASLKRVEGRDIILDSSITNLKGDVIFAKCTSVFHPL